MFSPHFTIEKNDITLEVFSVGSLGANSTLVKNKQNNCAIVFDPGLDVDYLKFLSTFRMQALIHTHAHFDHIGISHELKKITKAPIILQHNDLPLYQKLKEQAAMFGISIQGEISVDQLIDEKDLIEVNDTALNEFLKKLKIIHTPGHTQGSTCFYSEFFTRKLLIAGDTLFLESIGRTDLPGGNHEDILNSISKKLFTLPSDTQVITGHGPLTTIKHESANNPFFN